MEIKPKLTVSGYRGIWGESLNEQIAFEFALAFAKLIKEKGDLPSQAGKKILIGRDTRKSGSQIFSAISSAFQKEGLEVEDAGIIPSPSINLLIRKFSYHGGIIITASHNPIEYNGLKFIMKSGLFAGPEEIEQINKIKTEIKDKYVPEKNLKDKEIDNSNFRKFHIDEILKNIDLNLIKNKKYKVSLDTINGAGSIILPELLKELNCKVKIINGDLSGNFAHEPEPLVKNLSQLSKEIQNNNSDIGFAVDPDADRLIVVDEKGEIISEEYTLALAAKNILTQNPSDIVVNMSTSRMCEDLANLYGKKLIRTKVGELNVVNKMLEINSTISGEGNGRVIFPKINITGDSLVGIGLILELMAKENKKISEITKEIPKYVFKKEKTTFNGNLDSMYQNLKNKFPDAKNDTLDGLRFDWPDFSWVHIRQSNTEPIVRIYGEAKEENRLKGIIKEIKKILNQN